MLTNKQWKTKNKWDSDLPTKYERDRRNNKENPYIVQSSNSMRLWKYLEYSNKYQQQIKDKCN